MVSWWSTTMYGLKLWEYVSGEWRTGYVSFSPQREWKFTGQLGNSLGYLNILHVQSSSIFHSPDFGARFSRFKSCLFYLLSCDLRQIMTITVTLVLSVPAGGHVPGLCLSFTHCPAPGASTPMAWQLAVQEFREESWAGPWGLAGPGREGLDSKFMKYSVSMTHWWIPGYVGKRT